MAARRNLVRGATTVDETPGSVRVAFAAAGLGIVVGALLPWATVSAPRGASFTVNSWERANDGWIAILLGLAVIGIAAVRLTRRSSVIVAGPAGVVAAWIGIDAWIHLRRTIEMAEKHLPSPVRGLIGPGLWLTVLASLGLVGLSFWLELERRSADAPGRRR